MTVSIPEGASRLLRDIVHEHAGVYFDERRLDALVDKLLPLVLDRGFTSLLDYYYLLKYDSEAAAEWPRVLDALAVPETYFWREIDQLRSIVDLLVPECARISADGQVRIWCAAAATGEEPLTLAILLDQKGLLSTGQVSVAASDGSGQLITKARQGVYRERSLRIVPPEMKQLYFERSGDNWSIDPELTARVSWSTANLRDRTDVARLADVHIIVCRNVFIYFSDQAIADTVEGFARHMCDPAYLCLGASESLLRLRTSFDLLEAGSSFVYRARRTVETKQSIGADSMEAQGWTA